MKQNFMKRLKHANKGITLIALVITIIVLLILVGVSIAMLTGENGLLTKASDAKTKTVNGSEMEQIKIEVLGSFDNNGSLEIGTINSNIKRNIVGVTTDDATEFPLKITYTSSGNSYFIDEKGNVTNTNIDNGTVTLKAADITEKYGEEVTYTGYSASDVSKWRLYYADSDNVYLISEPGKYLQNQNLEYEGEISNLGISLNSNSIIWNYQCGVDANDNPVVHKGQKAAAYLTNTGLWEEYCNSSAKWAIGAPTVELFLASYNATHSTQITMSSDEKGYDSISSVFEYNNTIDSNIYCSTNSSREYWLASPSNNSNYNMLMAVGATEFIDPNRTWGYGWCSSKIDGLRLRYIVCVPREKLNVENMSVL